MKKLLNKITQTVVDTQMIRTKKNTFQLELKNRLTALNIIAHKSSNEEA